MLDRFRPYYIHVKPFIGRFALGVLCGVVAGLANGFGMPLMVEKVFPIIFANKDGQYAEVPLAFLEFIQSLGFEGTRDEIVLLACLGLPLIFIVRGIAGFFSTYLVSFVGVSVLERLRLQIFEKIQRLPMAFLGRFREGDLMSRVMSDTAQLQQALVQASADIIVHPISMLAAAAYLVMHSIRNEAVGVILVVLLSIPVCVFPIRYFSRKLKANAGSLQEESASMTSVLAQNLASQSEVRAYTMEERQIGLFAQVSRSFARYMMKTVKYGRFTSPLVEIVSALGVAFAIYFGASKGLTLDAFVPVVLALYMAYEPIKKLGLLQNKLRQGEASLDRLELILNAEDTIADPDKPREWTTSEGMIQFKDVSFSYGEDPVLTGLNLTIEPGKTIALVGESGCGKTTMVNLIERFYEVTEGAVEVDGLDVRDVKIRALRERIAYVAQAPILFDGTIEENIRIGKPDAHFDEIVDAAKQAHAHEFIDSMPDGYKTILGERGTGLSGGQRQRVAIARAHLKNAPLLILDEATSALDSESEARVQEALSDLARERTTLIIAHRFSSIRHADRILVFEKSAEGGRITGDGTHDELYETHTLYRTLFDRQSLTQS